MKYIAHSFDSDNVEYNKCDNTFQHVGSEGVDMYFYTSSNFAIIVHMFFLFQEPCWKSYMVSIFEIRDLYLNK